MRSYEKRQCHTACGNTASKTPRYGKSAGFFTCIDWTVFPEQRTLLKSENSIENVKVELYDHVLNR